MYSPKKTLSYVPQALLIRTNPHVACHLHDKTLSSALVRSASHVEKHYLNVYQNVLIWGKRMLRKHHAKQS